MRYFKTRQAYLISSIAFLTIILGVTLVTASAFAQYSNYPSYPSPAPTYYGHQAPPAYNGYQTAPAHQGHQTTGQWNQTNARYANQANQSQLLGSRPSDVVMDQREQIPARNYSTAPASKILPAPRIDGAQPAPATTTVDRFTRPARPVVPENDLGTSVPYAEGHSCSCETGWTSYCVPEGCNSPYCQRRRLPAGWGNAQTRSYGYSFLPDGSIYQEYIADPQANRSSLLFNDVKGDGTMMDGSFGINLPLLRYGSRGGIYPEGIELAIGGVAMLRFRQADSNLWYNDYRINALINYRRKAFEFRFGYQHYCSHLADEAMINLGYGLNYRNYGYDAVIFGIGWRPVFRWLEWYNKYWQAKACVPHGVIVPSLRLFTEGIHSFSTGSEQYNSDWSVKLGLELAPVVATGSKGAPYFAGLLHLRKENDWDGFYSLQAGWAWRAKNGRTARLGVNYYDGYSMYGQETDQKRSWIGGGLWLDL